MDPAEIDRLAAAGHLQLSGADLYVEGHDPWLPTRHRIGEVAALALAEVGDGARTLSIVAGGDPGPVSTSVKEGAQAIISFGLLRVDGEPVARTNQSNPFVRPHRCADGRWVYLHGGFPHLQAGLAELFGVAVDAPFDVVAAACRTRQAQDLENEIADRRLCGAMLRTTAEWHDHEHGSAVQALPTVITGPAIDPIAGWEPASRRPLAGLRVLDLTRVLAGPACGRTLAALGADVLQVTSPATPNVPVFVIDTGHGKRRAFCDFTNADELQDLRHIAQRAHVIVQGYRPGVVERFGLDAGSLRTDGFTGLHASVSCYGPTGPFAQRAGWEQLAQSVSGLADFDAVQPDAPAPTMLPAAATDYTTGFRLAGAIVRALEAGHGRDLHASLCQTAAWIQRAGSLDAEAEPHAGLTDGMATSAIRSSFGTLTRLEPGVRVQGLDVSWRSPSASLGSSSLSWRGFSNW